MIESGDDGMSSTFPGLGSTCYRFGSSSSSNSRPVPDCPGGSCQVGAVLVTGLGNDSAACNQQALEARRQKDDIEKGFGLARFSVHPSRSLQHQIKCCREHEWINWVSWNICPYTDKSLYLSPAHQDGNYFNLILFVLFSDYIC
ncbi:hypothetical protein U9M48_041050 [Paspalum notatum var. saurae]|uniref:Uncharacterized protein n=1 Tax=Paspalum notatum var. saurae TaxID=547442 RepID=A0AAQ3UTM8_PASNO